MRCRPTHLNGRHWVHVLPFVSSIVATVCLANSIHCIRLADSNTFRESAESSVGDTRQPKFERSQRSEMILLDHAVRRSSDECLDVQYLQARSPADWISFVDKAAAARAGGSAGHLELVLLSSVLPDIAECLARHQSAMLCSADVPSSSDRPATKTARRVVVLAAQLGSASGNLNTALRICAGLRKFGCVVHLLDVSAYQAAAVDAGRELATAILQRAAADVVLALHAVRAAPLFVPPCVPLIVVLGGTDVNVAADMNERSVEMMRLSVRAAKAVVSFSRDMREKLAQIEVEAAFKCHVIPQTVSIPSALPVFSLSEDIVSRGQRIVLLPAGLRAVKDVLFVVDALEDANLEYTSMVIVGPVLDASYAASVFDRLARSKRVLYHPPISRGALLSLMTQAAVVVNTSISEGMCGALMEAMTMGTVVIARANSGNLALIEHGRTGLVFDTAPEFVDLLGRVLASDALRTDLSKAAQEHMRQFHDCGTEAKAYNELCGEDVPC